MKRPHIPALDGLRGLAALLVFVHHTCWITSPTSDLDAAWAELATVGWTGVDLFFVLSGFLITGILCDSKDHPRYFRNFYARRALRIFPLYFLFVGIISAWYALADPSAHVLHGDLPWYLFFVQNFRIATAHRGLDTFLMPTWTLAIEEQFYLFWPLLVLGLSQRRLRFACLALAALSFCARSLAIKSGLSHFAIFPVTPLRLEGLALGGYVALTIRDPEARALLRRAAGPATVCALISLIVLRILTGPIVMHRFGTLWLGFALLALLFAGLLTLCVNEESPSWFARLVSWRPLRTLGKYSYAFYLLHGPINYWVFDCLWSEGVFPLIWGSALPALAAHMLVTGAASLALSWLSWQGIEKWALGLKTRFETPQSP